MLPPIWVELVPTPLPPRPPLDVRADSTKRYQVFVADWGYHTSIFIEQLPDARLGPPGRETSRFVEFAWGDRRFYMESDYRPHSVVATLFLPTAAVTYVDAWNAAPRAGAGVRSLDVRNVSARELSLLVNELARWRASDRAYPVVRGYRGRFYPAPGAYLWWDDCNRWTVERLASAGLARGGRGVILAGQVRGRLLGFHRAGSP